MYRIQITGLGFIHRQWKADEPKFCSDVAKAKSWKDFQEALAFGNQELTPRIHLRWELWQEREGQLVPIIRPRI